MVTWPWQATNAYALLPSAYLAFYHVPKGMGQETNEYALLPPPTTLCRSDSVELKKWKIVPYPIKRETIRREENMGEQSVVAYEPFGT